MFLDCASQGPATRVTTAYSTIHDVYIGDAKGNLNISKEFLAKGHAIAETGSKL